MRIRPTPLNSLVAMLLGMTFLATARISSADGLQCPGTWAPTGSMSLPRRDHTATMLNNGKVLIVGWFTQVAELYDPASGVFTQTTSTLFNHGQTSTATRLLDGRVLVAGGNGALTSAELFDPATGLFTATGSLNAPHYAHTAILLRDGKVLIAGGGFLDAQGHVLTSAIAELYDPVTGVFTLTGSLNIDRIISSSVLLPSGLALILGGDVAIPGQPGYANTTTSAELYNPALGVFTRTSDMLSPHCGLWWVGTPLLANGKVLIVSCGPPELYDPGTGGFQPTGIMTIGQELASATLLADGRVLIAGGMNESNGDPLYLTQTYDPSSGTFSETAPLLQPRQQHTATLLANGSVLLTGGYDRNGQTELGSAEIYTVTSPTAAIAAGGPTTFCQGGGVVLSATPSGGSGSFNSYQWYRDAVAIPGATTATYSATASGAYTSKVTDSTGCASDSSNAVSVTVLSLPTALVAGTTVICKGAATTLEAALTGIGPWNLIWSDGFVQSAVAASPAKRSVAPHMTTTYAVTLVSDANCTGGSSSGSAVVTVQKAPKAVVSGDTTICTGSSAVIQAALTGTAPWSLTWSDGFTQTVSASPATRTVSPSTQTTYLVTSVTDAACTGTATGNANVKVKPLPSADITAPASVCANSTGNVASVPGAGNQASYAWSITNGTITSDQGARKIKFTAGSSGPVSLSVTLISSAGCTSSGSLTVPITAVPNGTIAAPASVCRKQTGYLASVTDAGAGATYEWKVSHGTITAGAGTQTITFSGGGDGAVTIRVTITNAGGCTTVSTIDIPLVPGC